MQHSLVRAHRLALVVILSIICLIGLAVLTTPSERARANDNKSVTIDEALAQAKETGQPVQATAETTETKTILANPDGTLTADFAAAPVRQPDPANPGAWKPIDLSLGVTDDGLEPAVSSADLVFSDGGSDDMVALRQGPLEYAQEWIVPLPAPSVSGSVATYADILPGIDLRLQARNGGFEQEFIVHTPPKEPPVFRVPLRLVGVTAEIDEAGQIIVSNSEGSPVARGSTARMWGAAVDPATNEPTVSAVVGLAIDNGRDGPILEVRPDPAFFTNPDLTYPVTVDPSSNLSVITDTYVSQSSATSSFSTSSELKIGTPDGTDVMRSLLKFPTVGTVLGGPYIVSSTLNLYEISSYSCNPSEILVYSSTSSWDSSVTWNTQPTVGTLYASAVEAHGFSSSCPSDWVRLTGVGFGANDLIQLVQRWADGTEVNNGVIVQAGIEDDVEGWKKFVSAEAVANVPTLSVTYQTISGNQPPVVPNDLETDPEATPVTLHGTFTDPDGGTGRLMYTIYQADATTAVVTDAPGGLVASGQDSPYTIPAGVLQSGSLYTWTARSSDGTLISALASPVLPLDSVVGTEDGASINYVNNPWNCELDPRWPHRSSHYPEYIVAESHTIDCDYPYPPNGKYRIVHRQYLYRSSYSGWRFVRRNLSWCDVRTKSDGQSWPSCNVGNSDRMAAWVRWNCVADGFSGRWYNHLTNDYSVIYQGQYYWDAWWSVKTGNWNAPGNVQCLP